MTIIIPTSILKEWEAAFNALSQPRNLVPIPERDFKITSRCDSSVELYVIPETLTALYVVKGGLRLGEGIEIYSAYRSPDLQFKLWIQRVKDIAENNPAFCLEDCVREAEQYTASAYHPGLPPHMRGDALDVRLLINGKRALLVTNPKDYQQMRFDYFATIDPTIHANRQRLRELMTAGGFVQYEKEFWHFGLTPIIIK